MRRGRREPVGTVSFCESVSLEGWINPIALDDPLFGGFAVGAPSDEMRELEAVDNLVFRQMHFDGSGRATTESTSATSLSGVCRRASCWLGGALRRAG